MFSDIYKGKKVLITGDTGFKGSWLSIWLLELGADVYGYSLPPEGENDNFVICKLDEKINHIDSDVRDLTTLINYFRKIKPDITFHMAAQPLVLESYKNPEETYSTNLSTYFDTDNFTEKSPRNYFEYELLTPWKAILSTSANFNKFIFGKEGWLSVAPIR